MPSFRPAQFVACSVCHCLALPNAPVSILAENFSLSSSNCLIILDRKVEAFPLWAALTAAVESWWFGAVSLTPGIYTRDRGGDELKSYFCHVDKYADIMHRYSRTLAQWLAPTPHGKKVQGLILSLSVCSPCACLGCAPVSPPSKHVRLILQSVLLTKALD